MYYYPATTHESGAFANFSYVSSDFHRSIESDHEPPYPSEDYIFFGNQVCLQEWKGTATFHLLNKHCSLVAFAVFFGYSLSSTVLSKRFVVLLSPHVVYSIERKHAYVKEATQKERRTTHVNRRE